MSLLVIFWAKAESGSFPEMGLAPALPSEAALFPLDLPRTQRYFLSIDQRGTAVVGKLLSQSRFHSPGKPVLPDDALRSSGCGILSRFSMAGSHPLEEILTQVDFFLTLPVGVVFQDKHGTITAANPAAEQILGLSFRQLVGLDSVDPRWQARREDGSEFPGKEHPAMVALRLGKIVSDVVMGIFHPRYNETHWITITAVPILDPETGQAKGVYTTFKDITREKVAEEGLRRANLQLAQLAQKLEEQVRTDMLTGLANRLAFDQHASLEFERSRRFLMPASLLMIDIDHFKQINDRYGHEAGDRCLKRLGEILRKAVRVTDLAARYGGEEFVILLAGSDATTAEEKAEQIRQMVEVAQLPIDGTPIHVTVSIGVASFLPEDAGWTNALHRADKALYHAKNSGRNRVILSGHHLAEKAATLHLHHAENA